MKKHRPMTLAEYNAMPGSEPAYATRTTYRVQAALETREEMLALLEECLANSPNQGSPWRKRAMVAVLKARGQR